MTNEGYIIKQYNRRWINLILFVIYAINNSIHCNQYTVITDSISAYYSVPKLFVEWTSGLFSLTYVIFFAPVLYGMEKITLKQTMILASSLSTVGSWIKVFSVEPDRFLLAFISQCLVSTSYTFTFGVSAQLIATWFGVHESSRASAMSLFGDQFGVAASYIIPVIMVQESLESDTAIWEYDLRRMHISNATISTLCLILIILIFKDKPKNPPSMCQAVKLDIKSETFTESFKKMAKNRAFLMLMFWYSICGALLRIFGAVLGELISINFEDSYGDAGKIGFLMSAFSMLSTPLLGYVMDKVHKFRPVGIALTTGTFITFLLFTVALKMNNIILIYAVSIFLGIFVSSAYINGIQFGIEILYPMSEVKCSAMMVFIRQLVSTVFLALYGVLLRTCGDTIANSTICILTFAGAVVCCLSPIEMNRYEAEQEANVKELKEFLSKPNP